MLTNAAVETIAPTQCEFLFGDHFLPSQEKIENYSVVMGELNLNFTAYLLAGETNIEDTPIQKIVTGNGGTREAKLADIERLKSLIKDPHKSIAFLDGKSVERPDVIAKRYNDMPTIELEHVFWLSMATTLACMGSSAVLTIISSPRFKRFYGKNEMNRREFLKNMGIGAFMVSSVGSLVASAAITPVYLRGFDQHQLADNYELVAESILNSHTDYREDFGSAVERIVQMRNAVMAHNFNAINDGYNLDRALFFAGGRHGGIENLIGVPQEPQLIDYADRLVEVADSLQREFTQKGYPIGDVEYIVQSYLRLFGDYRILKESLMHKKTDEPSGPSARYVLMKRIIEKINDAGYSPMARGILERSINISVHEDRTEMSKLCKMFPNLEAEYSVGADDSVAAKALEDCGLCLFADVPMPDASVGNVFCGIAHDDGITVPVYMNSSGTIYGADKKNRFINSTSA